MPNYIFSNIIGSFIFDSSFRVIDKIIFRDVNDYYNKEVFENKLINKYKPLERANEKWIKKMLSYFKNKAVLSYFQKQLYHNLLY